MDRSHRILVAGATGYLGRFVARELKARGHFVRALTRSEHKLDDLRDELDEIFIGEVTRPETLQGMCDGIDIVFSSVGITKQKDGLSFYDVDYRGNHNLLALALEAGVPNFMYTSVLNGPKLRRLAIIDAHERFVDELCASGLNYCIVRPTGYFSDMEELFKMALKGRVYLFGNGEHRTNPIHGADLAAVCADNLERHNAVIPVGGPQTATYRQFAHEAFAALGRTEKITGVPLWVMSATVALTKLFNKHQGELLDFLSTMMTSEVVAESAGHRTLPDYFRNLAAEQTEK